MAVAGSSVLVTGASAGIGAALSVALARAGAARLGLVGRREDKLAGVAATCRDAGAAVEVWVQDLDDAIAAERMVADAWERFDGLDVLVNNAAIPMRRDVRSLSLDDLHRTMRIDFETPVRMTLALLPRWLERDHGMVVNVSSLGGRLGIVHETAYCAAKFALCGFTEAMAMDLWDTGVQVRLIVPGPVDTDIWDRPDTDPPHYDGPKEPPETVAAGIVAAIEGPHFEHYLPDLKGIAEFKTSDIETFLEGAAAMARDEP
jgi:short-subunit dehydrogenase